MFIFSICTCFCKSGVLTNFVNKSAKVSTRENQHFLENMQLYFICCFLISTVCILKTLFYSFNISMFKFLPGDYIKNVKMLSRNRAFFPSSCQCNLKANKMGTLWHTYISVLVFIFLIPLLVSRENKDCLFNLKQIEIYGDYVTRVFLLFDLKIRLALL